MTLEDYNASINPKVQGTWNLHHCLPKDTLDFFILLSSAVGTTGNASQAAYAAASTFQDAFASYRTNLGLPAISLDLGMITNVGYVAENHSVQQGLEKLGFEGVNEVELMAMLKSAIMTPLRTSNPAYTISGLGSYKEGDLHLRPALADPRFSHFRRMGEYLSQPRSTSSPTKSVTESFHTLLRGTSSLTEATHLIYDAIIGKLADLLMVPREDIRLEKSMGDYGMDSLVAVQMRAWVMAVMEVQVGILEVVSGGSIKEFAGVVAGKLGVVR